MKGRESETNQMMCEETLTAFDLMRQDRDKFSVWFDQKTAESDQRQSTIEQITADHAEKERSRVEALNEAGTQTTIGQKYFEKKPNAMAEMGSSRGSGSV